MAQELDSRLSTRIGGRCIKHRMGAASVKVYDKFGRVLRIETTANDVSFFKRHRKVEHRDGHDTYELAALKKPIYSLTDLRGILAGCNRRYLAFLSSLDDPSGGERDLRRLSQTREEGGERFKGIKGTSKNYLFMLRQAQHEEAVRTEIVEVQFLEVP